MKPFSVPLPMSLVLDAVVANTLLQLDCCSFCGCLLRLQVAGVQPLSLANSRRNLLSSLLLERT